MSENKEAVEKRRRQNVAQRMNYTDMEKVKPRKTAVEAFKRKPYSIER